MGRKIHKRKSHSYVGGDYHDVERKYRVGAVLIDTQHQELFKRVSSFISIVQSPRLWDEKVEKSKKLAFMQEYVVIHFSDEERFQKRLDILNEKDIGPSTPSFAE